MSITAKSLGLKPGDDCRHLVSEYPRDVALFSCIRNGRLYYNPGYELNAEDKHIFSTPLENLNTPAKFRQRIAWQEEGLARQRAKYEAEIAEREARLAWERSILAKLESMEAATPSSPPAAAQDEEHEP